MKEYSKLRFDQLAITIRPQTVTDEYINQADLLVNTDRCVGTSEQPRDNKSMHD